MSWLFLYVGFMIIKDKLGFLHFRQKKYFQGGIKLPCVFARAMNQRGLDRVALIFRAQLSKHYYMALIKPTGIAAAHFTWKCLLEKKKSNLVP